MTSEARAHWAWVCRAATASVLCVGCATVPPQQLVYAPLADGEVAAYALPCTGDTASPTGLGPHQRLPGPLLRILSWNIHKNADPGWDAALAGYAAEADLLLIQEAALTPALRQLLGEAGAAHWMLAGAWGQGGVETGVLSGARVAAVTVCVQRSFEPLLQLPKAALISRYAMQGTDALLAVATLHAINFTLGLAEYQAQLDALIGELASSPQVTASDHNPVLATLRLQPR